MTRVFRQDLHKELWEWLARNPQKHKYQWPRWSQNRGSIDAGKFFCVACFFNTEHKKPSDPVGECTCCPICINGRDTLKGCMGGLFEKWFLETDLVKKAEVARIIRDLPVREEYRG